MSAQPLVRLSPEEYLELDRAAEVPSEYYDGEMFTITGTTANHERIAINLGGGLWVALKKKPCEVFSRGMRVRVTNRGPYTYPDLVIACPAEFADERNDTLVNPVAILEVLSPSTEDHDRGRKFVQSRVIETLREYIVISQDQPRVECFRRQPDGSWVLTDQGGLDQSLELRCLSLTIPFTEIYDKVEFPAAEAGSPA